MKILRRIRNLTFTSRCFSSNLCCSALDEFSAHEGQVNCLRLGRCTGKVFATAGEDKKVNVWAIAAEHPLKTLLGHKSPVEAVSFDPTDEYLATGCADSSVSLWDINEEKIGRTFNDHHGVVNTVQFHPTKGYYIASGATDGQVKIWDARRKSCTYTLKTACSKAVTFTTFSPDGKWISAGHANGEIELWDIRSRKKVQSFTQHRDRINAIDFHPTECIMSTSSKDGTVRLWDLENFETIEKIGNGRIPVRCGCFSLDGEYVYSAVPDGLLCHSWEPTHLHATVSVSWNNAVDMVICEEYNRLVVLTSRNDSVGAWIVDLKKLMPKVKQEQNRSRRSSSESIPSLKIESPHAGSDTRDSQHSDRPNSGHLSSSTSARYSEKYGISPHSPSSIHTPMTSSTPTSAPSTPTANAANAHYSDRSCKLKLHRTESIDSSRSVRSHNPSSGGGGSARTPPDVIKSVKSPQKLNFSNLPPTPPLPYDPSNSLPPKASTYERGMVSSRTHVECQNQKQLLLLDKYNLKTERYGSKKDHPSSISSYHSRDINIEAFLPKGHIPGNANAPEYEPTDEECIRHMLEKKDKMRHILGSRVISMQIVRQFWERDDMMGTLKALKKSDNPSVTVDFFEADVQIQKILILELIPHLIPLLIRLLRTDHEKYWSAGLKIVQKLLKAYGGTIRETINGSNMSIGVNLAFEQRHEKCKMAHECLMETLTHVDKITKESGEAGILAREVQSRLSDLST